MARLLTDRPVLIQILSLYLLLLAFFIVLSRLSSGEKMRSEAVSSSLSITFATEGRPAKRVTRVTSLAGTVIDDPAPLARIGELVRAELNFAIVREIVPGGVMELTVETDRLFTGAEIAVNPLYRRFFERLAATLTDPPRDVRYDVEIAIGVGTAANEPGIRLAAARSAFLSAILTRAGAPARTLAAGVEPDAPARTRMVFHVRPAVEPLPPFAREPVR